MTTKNVNYKKFGGDWSLQAEVHGDGTIASAACDRIQAATLLMIRDELVKLNALLVAIPRKLDRIAKNTAKPRKRKKVKS